MSSNQAAYLVAVKAPLEVGPAPLPQPKENEIVVKTHAVAINPVDYYQQLLGPTVFTWLKLPDILGYDVAGEITDIGSGVTKFKVGDRVLGLTSYAFQNYVLVKEHCTTLLPDAISFEEAAVIPLGFSVGVKALFHKEYLNLNLPTLDAEPTGKVIVIWGGSTSVGSNTIQLARAAGFEVITTASPKNFDFVKKLGASQVFDYNSPTVKDDLITAVKGKIVAGAIANGGVNPDEYESIVDTCAAVVLSSPDNNKFIPLTMVPRFPLPEGVSTKFLEALGEDKDLAASIFNEFLPKALETGTIVPAPTPQVFGHGLEALQGAMDLLKSGVSASKVVVTM